MEQIYEQKSVIVPGLCGAEGALALEEVFRVFQDLAACHAQALGCGIYDLAAKNLFWLTVKTGIDVVRLPKMAEAVTLRTWPEAPGKMRCFRSYQILDGSGAVCVSGKTEWAVTNLETKQLAPMEGVYPAELTFEAGTARGSIARIPEGDMEDYGSYTVRSTDIDVGGHMNNAAYPRALLGSLSNAEQRAMNIRSMDVIFRAPCFEGEKLTLSRRSGGEGLDLRMAGERGTVLLARIGGTI